MENSAGRADNLPRRFLRPRQRRTRYWRVFFTLNLLVEGSVKISNPFRTHSILKPTFDLCFGDLGEWREGGIRDQGNYLRTVDISHVRAVGCLTPPVDGEDNVGVTFVLRVTFEL